MKKYHPMINFTSATTTAEECIKMIWHKNDKKDYIEEYHNRIKNLFGVDFAYSFAGGRMALYAILQAIGVTQNDEVIIQGYTCCVVPKAILYAGAKVVYADINTDDYGLDFASVKKKITRNTKAIIVQHTYGIPCRAIKDIRKLCDEKGICLIEDCAHVFGTSYQGKLLGTFGDAAFFSTDHTKYISTSIGGIAITNNLEIGEKLKYIYTTADEMPQKIKDAVVFQFSFMNILSNKYIMGIWNRYKIFQIAINLLLAFCYKHDWMFYMTDYGNIDKPKYSFPMKLSNVQAYIGLSQIDSLEKNIQHRKEITSIYKERLSEYFEYPQVGDALLRFPIQVKNPEIIRSELEDMVKIENWFSSVLECVTKEELCKFMYEKGMCPVAEGSSEHIINLPTHMKIKKEEANLICDKIIKFAWRNNG